MAIFHLSAQVISRGHGQSAIAAAAYRSGERLEDEQAGQQKHYTAREQRIEFTDILAPKDAPEWAHDRNQLWNHAERAEKRKDSQLAREIEVSLPHELTPQQREWLAKDFAREAFVRKGYAVDLAIHAPEPGKDDRNHHAHFMVTMRTLGPEGFAPKKDPSMNRREQLDEWREKWAHLANRHLERHGHEARIDHRSLKEQGHDREPTIHLGYAAKEIAARGAQSDRMDMQVGIIERNGVRTDIKAIERELERAEAEQVVARARGTDKVAPSPTRPQEPAVPFEHINARHAAAEADLVRSKERAAEKSQVETLAPAVEPTAGKAAAKAPQGQAKPVSSGLKVMSMATGILSGLGDFMVGVLAGPAKPEPAPRAKMTTDMTTLITDPEAARQQRIADVAALEQARNEEKALVRIGQDMAAGRNLKAEDVQSLTREHQEQVRRGGDDAMRQIVDDARKRSDTYWKGDERERER